MRLLAWIMAAVVALSACCMAVGQVGKSGAGLDEVAKYVDQTAVAVVRVDVARLDTDSFLAEVARTLSAGLKDRDPEALKEVEGQIGSAKAAAKTWRDTFTAAGGRELYLVIAFNPVFDPPVIAVVPTGEGARPQEIIGLLKALPLADGSIARETPGAVVYGPEGMLATLPLDGADRRAELASALGRAGDAPVAAAIIPADFVRRAIAENVTELPRELGGGPATVLTKGMVSGHMAVRLTPSWSMELVAQSESAAAAAEFAATLKRGLKGAGGEPEIVKAVASALEPRVDGSSVVISCAGERMETLKRIMAPAMVTARAAARRAVTASNMRQVVMGCLIYEQDKGTWPRELKELVTEKYLTAAMLQRPDRPGVEVGFEYIRPDAEKLKTSNASLHLVLHERFEKWPAQGIWAAYADGHVQIVMDEATFRKQVSEARAR